MSNSENIRGGSRTPGGRVRDFFSWLSGLWSPKYTPQRSRYGDNGRKFMNRNSDPEARIHDNVKDQ